MPANPFKVKAVFEYKSDEPDDLNFQNGQIITVIDDEDDDWYTGEYVNAAGEKVEGIFPRNFVEKYEPAIPSRPTRAPKRVPTQEPIEPATEPAPSKPLPSSTEPVKEAEIEPPKPFTAPPAAEDVELPATNVQEQRVPATTVQRSPHPVAKPAASKPAPPVAEKPPTSSFRDRIAAFNKPAAAPITPFKPGGQPTFIKKPFVAPPPSKNSYVPPPREPPPQKVYRREEDPSISREEEKTIDESEPPQTEAPIEDQPKPTSLKDRIALLQKQQLEQAARNAEKKEKPKRPPKKRMESSEDVEQSSAPVADVPLERRDTSDTVGKRSMDLADDEAEPIQHQPPHRTSGHLSPTGPTPASRELVSDTNDADDSGAGDTEDAQEISTEEERPKSRGIAEAALAPVKTRPAVDRQASEEANEEDHEEDDDEEDEDPEIRRRRELRDRMARLGGGMGMMGMFGGPAGGAATSRKAKPASDAERGSTEQEQEDYAARAPPVPIMALPGMSNNLPRRREEPVESESDQEETAQPTPQEPARQDPSVDDYLSQPPKRTSTDRSAPPPPQERAVPPPPSREIRAVPPPPPGARPPPAAPLSSATRPVPERKRSVPIAVDVPQPEDASDDDVPNSATSTRGRRSEERPSMPAISPPLPANTIPEAPRLDTSEPPSASSDKRISRGPPPVPTMSPTAASPQTRAPPPPPPAQPPSRRSTSDSHGLKPLKQAAIEDSEDEVTEYDGDYDTDIASSAKHKDALKSHNRDSSFDEGILTDDAAKSPAAPPTRSVPPLPPSAAPPQMPPPVPQTAPKTRKSLDAPRAAPPPVPPPTAVADDEDGYDPYRYAAPQHGLPSPSIRNMYSSALQSPREEPEEEDLYRGPPVVPQIPPPPVERVAPPPPSHERTIPPAPSTDRASAILSSAAAAPAFSEPARQSLDVRRTNTMARRSMEQSRPSGEHSIIASDIDLAQGSLWWTQHKLPPPILQGRNDVLCEFDEHTIPKGKSRTQVSKDVFVLYMDYSQSTINAMFDPTDPTHANFEQSHERPPPPPRADQLESASNLYGAQIAKVASGSLGGTVGDGSAQSFVAELLKPLNGALAPVGTRAYGALVYANLANASTQQYDEIRPGDIVTFRNAKFSGHKSGVMHAKYTQDVGKEHVGVVIDWDGSKRKIRAWEQKGEEKGKKAKVREESFRVGDLKSGEVRVWRVMPRTWVGWNEVQ